MNACRQQRYMIESTDLRFSQTGRIILRTNSFLYIIRCDLTCQVFTILVDRSHFFLLSFLFLAASHFTPSSPCGEGPRRENEPNRGEKWNIDFFFLFFPVPTQLLMLFSGFPFFTHHALFSSLAMSGVVRYHLTQ